MITEQELKAIRATHKHVKMLKRCGQTVTPYNRYALSRMFLRLIDNKGEG